jgi:acylphosphatase
VRNNPDGTVELVAEAEKSSLEELLSKCKQGSVWSRVEIINSKWEKPTGEFSGFEIMREPKLYNHQAIRFLQ